MPTREQLIEESRRSIYPSKQEGFTVTAAAPVKPVPAVSPALSAQPNRPMIMPRRRVYAGLPYYAGFVSSENDQLQRGMEAAGYDLVFPMGRALGDLDCDLLFMADPRDFLHPDLYGKYRPEVTQYDRWTVDRMPDHAWRVAPYKDLHWWGEWQARMLDTLCIHTVVTPYDHRLAIDTAARHGVNLYGRVVRTYHTLTPMDIPRFNPDARRRLCVVSGALDTQGRIDRGEDVYPMRTRCYKGAADGTLDTDVKGHPGYVELRPDTSSYMQHLSGYKVAICSCSRYKFALRKIIEATAAGCRVITDLPEALPAIGDNLYRVPPDVSVYELNDLVHYLGETWDPAVQLKHARAASSRYNMIRVATDLDRNINGHIKGEYTPCDPLPLAFA